MGLLQRRCTIALTLLSKCITLAIHSSLDLYLFNPHHKCGLFGVACEAKSMQVHYLIDEGNDIGKGANTTISLVHHYLQTHGLKEKVLRLHADNCVGQNKNNAFMHYLMWRVIAGLNTSIELSFMLVGHTKFAPDRFFGIFKQAFRRSVVETMTDMQQVVMKSSTSGKNVPQLTVDSDGNRYVHWVDWTSFFQKYFKPIVGITSFHHFQISKSNPGIVTVKEYANSPKQKFDIFKTGVTASSLMGQKPSKIKPKGLDPARQWYLYEQIRPFCLTDSAKDLTCPLLSVPKPS